jgi:cytochrome c2
MQQTDIWRTLNPALLAIWLAIFTCACPKPQTEPAPAQASAGSKSDSPSASQGASAPNPEAQAMGKATYGMQGCAMCHGDKLEGKKGLAPALSGLRAHWTEENMAAYLHDPQGYADSDPRLKANRENYSMRMPAYTKLTADEEAALIAFLLAN